MERGPFLISSGSQVGFHTTFNKLFVIKAGFVRSSLQMDACALGLSEKHACHTRFSDRAPYKCGVREERRSRPSRVALTMLQRT